MGPQSTEARLHLCCHLNGVRGKIHVAPTKIGKTRAKKGWGFPEQWPQKICPKVALSLPLLTSPPSKAFPAHSLLSSAYSCRWTELKGHRKLPNMFTFWCCHTGISGGNDGISGWFVWLVLPPSLPPSLTFLSLSFSLGKESFPLRVSNDLWNVR